jgi:hypothetical protein
MGQFVIVEVHRDHDAIEETDPRHDTIMSNAWDGSRTEAKSKEDAEVRTRATNPAKTERAGKFSKSPWPLIQTLHEERFGSMPTGKGKSAGRKAGRGPIA